MIDGVKSGGSLYRRVICPRCDDVGDDCDSYLRLLGGEVPQDLVALFLCSNSTADGAAVVKKLGEDVGSDEAVAPGKKNATGHFQHWSV